MDQSSREWSYTYTGPPAPTSGGEEDEIPACQSCRKKKLKCSRGLPSCSNCSKFACECVYDKKQKPGMKTGAVEGLNRRLEVLEKILLDGKGNQKPLICSAVSHSLQDGESTDRTSGNSSEKTPFLHGGLPIESSSQGSQSRKRKHQDDNDETVNRYLGVFDEDDPLSSLPKPRLLDAIVDTYFEKIHPWMPLLHEGRFRSRLENSSERLKLGVVLHALVSATMKRVDIEEYGIGKAEAKRQTRVSRSVVMLRAMDSVSVEGLQALIVVAVDHMGGGQDTKAWSIIGSLTRTVEYLQLTVEPDETLGPPLLRPRILLEKPEGPIEAEERRRVFWNVFLLDRFCSLTSGWSTSLTSDDVCRQLPCDGRLWRRGEHVVTPYFGIWSKSAARIGSSISYIPTLYLPRNDHDQTTIVSPGESTTSSVGIDKSKLGAFAYRIEATESLNQVTSFFLQQRVDFRNRQEVGGWLTRFKELDLRLVHWKMFLPQRWKDSDISRDVAYVSMDPNLTVAHLSHNTSMILLHQHIAYPPIDWSEIVKLPSLSSAETCQLAAIETASIAKKFLTYTGGAIIASQFPFCAFVAARVFLVHWKYQNTDLSPEFFSLIESLQEMSRRWQGYLWVESDQTDREDLDAASKYALQLQELHKRCLNDANFRMDIFSYSDSSYNASIGGSVSNVSTPQPVGSASRPSQARPQSYTYRPPEMTASPSGAFNTNPGRSVYSHQSPPTATGTYNIPHSVGPPRSGMLSMNSLSNGMPANRLEGDAPGGMSSPGLLNMSYTGEIMEDELTAMSHILLGQQFLEMDRVITLDGTDFDIDMSSWGNYR